MITKEVYDSLDMNIIVFDNTDIITQSNETPLEDT